MAASRLLVEVVILAISPSTSATVAEREAAMREARTRKVDWNFMFAELVIQGKRDVLRIVKQNAL